MALSSAFRERLEHMDYTRIQRLSLLQAEKELQVNKSQILASKLRDVTSMEQRCLILERNIAFQNYKILALKSEIQRLDAKYEADSQQLRVLKSEVEEVEELEKEKERFYEIKCDEMKEFQKNVEEFVLKYRIQVYELRNKVNELKGTFNDLQGKNGHLSNSEIAAAETRRAELTVGKENLQKKLASNYQIRSQLQNQLKGSILSTHHQDYRKPSQSQFTSFN
ncbi:uncharacterized protein LOC126683466 [Mercurialis annua]|uniref:uncharacterized protein LOC126683466 n=1 Tax=Mercurialis annua TaxID=3986 RepID=UPI00215E8032|nr:uncharacterized protein LOC126683466 [Mercurialis annua]